MENKQISKTPKWLFALELALTIIAGIAFVICAAVAKQTIEKIKEEGALTSALVSILFLVFLIVSASLAIASLVLSSIGFKKHEHNKAQLAFLITNAAIILGNIILPIVVYTTK